MTDWCRDYGAQVVDLERSLPVAFLCHSEHITVIPCPQRVASDGATRTQRTTDINPSQTIPALQLYGEAVRPVTIISHIKADTITRCDRQCCTGKDRRTTIFIIRQVQLATRNGDRTIVALAPAGCAPDTAIAREVINCFYLTILAPRTGHLGIIEIGQVIFRNSRPDTNRLDLAPP
ncbi:hypothetical protein D3C86_1264300 [compost metagenome]